ncbi:serine/threonine-protein kinase RIO1 isoform X2 [Cimex lectularius]|uniref:Serine/threonine-protein kinase RIO1 n=1 Tax=Cimex lectularius TaxID=79782 RepID=A0A8I6SE40_CIMLE|nr:serine/threonine-protein kinase RIO1 isoform X2 [Cimex lectularius]
MDIVPGQFDDAESEEVPPRKHVSFDLCHQIEELALSDSGLSEDEDEDYSEDEEYYEDFQCTKNSVMVRSNKGHPNAQMPSDKVSSYQPNDKLLKKYVNKINVEKYEGPELPMKAANYLIEANRKNEAERIRHKDKNDRATTEQVMDPRTRIIIFKLLNRGVLWMINGCISTGKEANVYHATSKSLDCDIAIKVYKTSILVFKDRDRYMTGEYRFRHGYCRHNPRKMVRLWAEKEMRNLVRMKNAGLSVPEPILLRSHVLLMKFLGEDGWPAPKLKDVELTTSRACKLYREIVTMMWIMYNKCKLVHADLSEFNLLYHEGHAYVIDVSQSVEHDHPHSFDFLKKDCTNINEFFRKKDVATMTVKQLFDFITDFNLSEDKIESYLDRISEEAGNKGQPSSNEIVDAEVFKNTFVPKRLDEVLNFERDINAIRSGQDDPDRITYKKVVGLSEDLTPAQDEDSSSDETEEEGKSNFVNSSRPRDESPESKKMRKKLVKEQQAEKRKTKIKKHVKKRKAKAK